MPCYCGVLFFECQLNYLAPPLVVSKALDKGACIVCGTEQGLFARVRRHSSAVVIRSTDETGHTFQVQLPLDPAVLRAEAAKVRCGVVVVLCALRFAKHVPVLRQPEFLTGQL